MLHPARDHILNATNIIAYEYYEPDYVVTALVVKGRNLWLGSLQCPSIQMLWLSQYSDLLYLIVPDGDGAVDYWQPPVVYNS